VNQKLVEPFNGLGKDHNVPSRGSSTSFFAGLTRPFQAGNRRRATSAQSRRHFGRASAQLDGLY
jgi:hypothetical protein